MVHTSNYNVRMTTGNLELENTHLENMDVFAYV